MTQIVPVTPDFAVAPQLTAADIARAGAEGYKVLVCNRPDGESPGDLQSAEAAEAAAAAGLAFHLIPFAGPPPKAAVDALRQALAEAPGPVLAYCRSGTRSITAWALAQATAGARETEEIIGLAAKAGYDLSGARAVLTQLRPG